MLNIAAMVANIRLLHNNNLQISSECHGSTSECSRYAKDAPGGRMELFPPKGRAALLRSLGGVAVHANKAFALEMQNNLLSSFLWREFSGIDVQLGIGWLLVGIADTGKLF